MGTELSDGTIIPSQLSPSTGLPDQTAISKTNYGLRTGQVIKIHYPEDPTNISKKYHEYDVLVAHGDARIGTNISVYRNCKVSNIFASDTDSEVYTLQPGTNSATADGTYVGGAIITLLCIDGRPDAGQALIMGGLNSPQYQFKTYTKADGNFYDFNFNGINVNINKDGEYTVQFNSVLDSKGKPTNSAAAGTKLFFDKEGRVSLSDNQSQSFLLDRVAKKAVWTNSDETITIDKANKSINVQSSGDFTESSAKDTSLKSGTALNLDAGSDMSIKAGGNQDVNVTGSATMKAANWNINVQGSVNIQAGGALMIQSGATAAIQALSVALGTGGIQAAGVGISLCQGIGNLGFPVYSTIQTGSFSVMIGT